MPTRLLLGISIWLYVPNDPWPVDLPYSAFLEQVRAGNVVEVEIRGQQITGKFKQAIYWPPDGTTRRISYDTFKTTLPPVNDQRLLPLLEEQGVTVNVRPPPSSLPLMLLVQGLPLLLLVGLIYWSNRRARQGQADMMNLDRSGARMYTHSRPTVSFADVAGQDQAKVELAEIADFLKDPGKYHRLGGRIPHGVLLVGPPGTGKTLLARAVAGEASVPFYSISASEFVQVYVGLGASRVRDLFKNAQKNAPSIIFVDEIDAVGRQREAGPAGGSDEREQTLDQLLAEMDGFDQHTNVIVIAATNRPDILDSALLRPGRFDRHVTVSMPDKRGRESILQVHSRSLTLSPDVELSVLAGATPGFSGADLANLCNEAALLAARHDKERVAMDDFDDALDKIMLGTERPRLMDERERRTVAYHEAGHALIASLLPGADPVHRVTIIPHGRSLGVTAQVPEEERYNYSLDDLSTRLVVLMGGRAAEEIGLGQVTTGAEEDLQQATRLAHGMVARWGMNDEMGLVSYKIGETYPSLGEGPGLEHTFSETTSAIIDREVKRLLQEAHQRATDLLTAGHEKLDRLVEALLQDETLDASEIAAALG